MNYKQEVLEKASAAMQESGCIRQVLNQYGVQRSTVSDCMSGRRDVMKPITHRCPPVIPTEIENKIVKSIKMAAW